MDNQSLNEIVAFINTKVNELQRSLLINSLTNVANNPMYSEEARRTAASRVENLLSLVSTHSFVDDQDLGLPNDVVR